MKRRNYDPTKAIWDPKTQEKFIEICIKEVEAGNRPGTHFSKVGWTNLIENFSKEAGRSYTKIQLKNKWDNLKNEWKIWRKLKQKETGLGWDPVLKTINASPEWWSTTLKEFPEASRFRVEGIDPELEEKLNKMFLNTVATGDHAWAPSESTETSTTNAIQVEENTCDFDEFVPIEAIKEKKGKRVVAEGRKVGGAAKLSRQIDRLVDAVERRSTITTNSQDDRSGASVVKALGIVASLPGAEAGSDLWLFASRLFLDKVKRDIFNGIDDPEVKLKWLNFEKTLGL